MLRNLGDIYNYTNVDLLNEELDSIDDVIEFLEEAQQKIAEIAKIEAPIATFVLTTNEITLPSDFLAFKEFTVNDIPVNPTKAWAGKLYLPKNIVSGTAELYYYKKPTSLVKTNLNQVPDIDSRYFYTMADYAAEMWKIKDDDEQKSDFRNKFFEGLTVYSTNKGIISNFKNVW